MTHIGNPHYPVDGNMISKILVFSRNQFKNGIHLFNEQNIGIISIINQPKDTLQTEKFIYLNRLENVPFISMVFSDTTLNEYNRCSDDVKKSLNLFNEVNAITIVNFINEYKNKIDTLIIHCEAGQSRSGAVVMWANRYLHLNEKEFLKNNKKVFPNYYVYDVLCKFSAMKREHKNFWENLERKDMKYVIDNLV